MKGCLTIPSVPKDDVDDPTTLAFQAKDDTKDDTKQR